MGKVPGKAFYSWLKYLGLYLLIGRTSSSHSALKAKSFDCLIGTISPEPSLFLGSYSSLIYSDQGTIVLLIVLQTYQPFSHPKTSALALPSAPEAFSPKDPHLASAFSGPDPESIC